MTFSRLQPYESWESFNAEARRLWEVYREETAPRSITRLAVRNINRINIPVLGAPVELKDYLRTSPELPADLPLPMKGFFMQTVLTIDAIKGTVIINETIATPASEGILPIILDIDIFRSDDCPESDNEMWQFFEDLRTQKNAVFEACITDRARELFQ